MKYRCSTCRNVYVNKLAAEMCHAGQQPAYVPPGHENDPPHVVENDKIGFYGEVPAARPDQGMDQPHHGHDERGET